MASSNLNSLNSQLEQLRTNAKAAEASIVKLTTQVRNLLAASARGSGTPTEGGLNAAIGRITAGTAGGRTRLGGGAYTTGAKEFVAHLDSLLNSLMFERFNLAYAQVQAELLSKVSSSVGISTARTGGIDAETRGILQQLEQKAEEAAQRIVREKAAAVQGALARSGGPFVPGGMQPYTPPPGGTISPGVNPLQKAMAQNKSFVGGMKDVGLPYKFPGLDSTQAGKIITEVERLVTLYDKLGITAQGARYSVSDLTKDLTKFEVAIANSAGGVDKLVFSLDKAGNLLNKTDLDKINQQAAQTKQQEALQRPISFMSPQKQGEFEALVQKQVSGLKDLGLTFSRTATSAEALDSGYVRFTSTMTSANGIQQRVNTYLDQNGNLLDENAYKLRKATEAQKRWNEEQLKAGLTPNRANIAMGLAQQKGFNVENLKQVYTQQPSGVSFLRFEKMDEATGVMQKMEVAMDKYGKVLNQTNRRLLGFTDSIIRNTTEVIKWSIGATLVYQAYFKLGDLIKTAIENQSKLADVTIALGQANRDLSSIFDDVATVAAQTGESISAVLETYVLAYRAVGAASNDLERTAAANKLLTDATILNKLSSLDASSAIDVLSGSLRQLAKPQESTIEAFDRGTYLLDRWVALTRRANVDLATLATAFSITAESAENSGVNIEELNAIIASLAEKIGGLGGRETGNAVRALIGGVYQQQAAGALADYGIAISNTEGQMRDFLDISKDIFELWNSGVISDAQLNKLGYTLGGGVRRGQQYVAFLSDYARIQDLVVVQSEANGSAQDALGKKLDTVQTSITRVGNAFQRLSQAMGDQGGVLGVATLLLNVVEGLVNGFANLNRTLGQIAIPATLVALGALYTRLGGSPASERLFAGQRTLGYGLGQKISDMGILSSLFGGAGATAIGRGVQSYIGKGGLYGLGLTAPAAISRFGQGQKGAGVADLVGSIGGGIVGEMIGMGPIIGSILGTAIAEFFVEATIEKEEDFQSLFARAFRPEEAPTLPIGTDVGEQKRTVAEEAIYAYRGYGNEAVGKMFSAVDEFFYNIVGELQYGGKFEGLNQLQAAAMGRGGMGADALRLSQEAATYTPKTITYEESAFAEQQAEIEKVYGEFLDNIASEFRDELRKKLLTGDIGRGEYKTELQSSYKLAPAVTRLFTALNAEGSDFKEIVGDISGEFENLSDLILNASEEDRLSIAQIVTELSDMSRALEELKGKAPDAMTEFNDEMLNAVELTALQRQKLEELLAMLDLIKVSQERTRIENIKLPDVLGAEGQVTPDNFQKIMDKAKELQEERIEAYKMSPEFDEEGFRLQIAAAEPFLVYMGEQMGYMLAEGLISSDFFQMALSQMDTKIGYDFMDVTYEQFQSVMDEYERLKAQIEEAGGTVEETGLLMFFKDRSSPVYMEKDWKLVQYLLQQILDTEEKQLDGIYNLPSGASFYVPFQAYALGPEGTEEAPAEETDLAEAANALRDAAIAMWDISYANGPDPTPAELQAILAELRKQTIIMEANTLSKAQYYSPSEMEPSGVGYPVEGIPTGMTTGDKVALGLRFIDPVVDFTESVFDSLKKTLEQGTGNESFDELTEPIRNLALKIIEGIGNLPMFTNIGDIAGLGEGDTFSERLRTGIGVLIDKILAIIENALPDMYGTGTEDGTSKEPTPWGGGGVFEGLATALDNLTNAIKSWNPFGTSGTYEGGEIQNTMYYPGGKALASPYPEGTTGLTSGLTVSTNLTINLNTETQLIVDGRILAEIVKPYLYQDLITYESASGSATRSYTSLA